MSNTEVTHATRTRVDGTRWTLCGHLAEARGVDEKTPTCATCAETVERFDPRWRNVRELVARHGLDLKGASEHAEAAWAANNSLRRRESFRTLPGLVEVFRTLPGSYSYYDAARIAVLALERNLPVEERSVR